MDKKELIILGIIVIVAVVIAAIILAPQIDAKSTSIEILNENNIGENGTLYVKLKDSEKGALGNETIHIKLTDKKNNVIYEKNVKTHTTGVAIVKLDNITGGTYNVNATFDGDANFTGCSISQKLTVKGEVVEDTLANSTLIRQTLAEDQQDNNDDDGGDSYDYSDSSDSSSYTPSQSSDSGSNSRSSDSEDSGPLPEYDEDGYINYDENGKMIG
jgi:hypothetical protein